MKAKRVSVLLVLGGLLLQPLPSAGPGATAQGNSLAAPLAPRRVIINELAPITGGAGSEWVELLNLGGGHSVYMPLLLHNYRPGRAMASLSQEPPLDAVAQAGSGLDISGWQVGDEDGNVYTIPASLGPLPIGGYVQILFDGQGPGADDYDFGDGVAVLHTPAGLVNIFDDKADQVALYTSKTHKPDTLHDFVAYGAPPGADGDNAVEAGLWRERLYVADTEPIPGAQVLLPGGSAGLLPGGQGDGRDAWGLYKAAETTPGAENTAPSPDFRSPPEDVETTDRRIPFGWTTVLDATGYQFQLARDTGFTSLVVDEVVHSGLFVPSSDLPEGTYHYRARARLANGSYSGFSGPGQVTILPGSTTSAPQEATLLGLTPLLQHKDSNMICVDGHKRDALDRWDSAHEDDGDWEVGNGNPLRGNSHDDNYCTRAAIAMIVSYYGGNLSQDRISYHKYGGGVPEDDLGHSEGLWPDQLCTTNNGVIGEDDVLTWAMNGDKNECGVKKPSFDQIKGWIDAKRPVLLVEDKGNKVGHAVVVDGYTKQEEFVQRIDPLTASASWIKYSTLKVAEYHCPEGKKTPLSNEDDFYLDSDLDGLINFDEKNRLDTSASVADSDSDGVNDKWDLHELYYNSLGDKSHKNAAADVDADGLRKEVDPDNDGGGALDGCEDANGNGVRNFGETNNFDPSDDVPCIPVVDDVYTTDYAEKLKTSFRPGEAIVLVIKATNNAKADKTAKLTWDTRSPTNQPVGYLSLADYSATLAPSTDAIWIDRGIAKGQKAGTYTFNGSLVHGGRETSDSSTFTVAGTPVSIGLARALSCKDVVDNLFVDKTDTFTSSDEKAVVWTVWEGAWGTHTVKFEWVLPDGTHYFDYSHSFSTGEALYKTWSWIEGIGLWQTGTYKVKVYLDKTLKTTVQFNVTSGEQSSTAGAPQGAEVGGGGGAARSSLPAP